MIDPRTPRDDRARLFRDSEHGVILGVCAGIAASFACPPWLLRIAALVLAWFFLEAVLVAYVVAALLLPERPLRYTGRGDETSFWRSGRQGG